MNDSLDRYAARKLEAIERRAMRRELAVTDRTAGGAVVRDGRPLVSFACNDYLGLSRHDSVVAAAVRATRRYGAGSGASRLITGNHPLYDALERRLAALKGTEDAVVFGSGYLANVGALPVLAGPADLIAIDELGHSCLLTGARLSRATVVRFRHNDTEHARALLERHRTGHRNCLLITEGVFSMEGDLAPLPTLAELARTHGCWLMTDDAHGLGVVGGGRGSSFAHRAPVTVPLQMGTLSKAVGAYGGYVAASKPVADLLRNRARSFAFSTGLPPATVAAAIAALDIIAAEPERTARPAARASAFSERLGLPVTGSAIVPLVLGSARRALEASRALAEAGFLVPAIRPPSVPTGTSRLRFAFSAAHTDADIDALCRAVERIVPDRRTSGRSRRSA